MAAVLASHLDAGLTPAAAAHALEVFTDTDMHGGRLIPAAADALQLLARETRQGLACRRCGHDDHPLAPDHLCGPCTDTTTNQASSSRDSSAQEDTLPAKLRAQICQGLGLTRDHVATFDPDAAADSFWETTGGPRPCRRSYDPVSDPTQNGSGAGGRHPSSGYRL